MGKHRNPDSGRSAAKDQGGRDASCRHLPDNVPFDAEKPPKFPGDITYYFPIPLGGKTGAPGGCPVTGVFIPKGFTYPSTIDVVLFFHGNKQQWSTIQDYWMPGGVHHIRLRQDVNDSGKQVILVAPTMGSNPGWSGDMTGDLDTKGADDLLDDVMVILAGWDPHYINKDLPKVGSIALAAHSGGGETLLRQTMLMKKYRGNIRACWGFDCTYDWAAIRKLGTGSNAENWIQWAVSRGDVENHFHYQKGSSSDPNTDTETVALAIGAMASGKAPLPGKPGVSQKLPNVQVHPSADGHYDQLNKNFPIRMAARTSKFPP
jgi:hypothetical protein